MKFQARITSVATDKGYGNPDRIRVEFDLADNAGQGERAIFALYLAKEHPEVMTFMAAWQNNRTAVVAVDLA